jgi:hypothetical protein
MIRENKRSKDILSNKRKIVTERRIKLTALPLLHFGMLDKGLILDTRCPLLPLRDVSSMHNQAYYLSHIVSASRMFPLDIALTC